MKTIEKTPLLAAAAVQAIRDHIIAENLQPGDPMPPEGRLAKDLGISRNSVREAVKGLEALGIVEARRGSGLYVKAFSYDSLVENLPLAMRLGPSDLSDLVELRAVLEVALIARTAEGVGRSGLKDAREALELMRIKAEQGLPFPAEDRAFHVSLYKGYGNTVWLKILGLFWDVFNQSAKAADLRDPNPLQTYRNHLAILEALDAGDPVSAQTAMHIHYRDLRMRIAALSNVGR